MRSLRSSSNHPAWIGIALAFYAFIAIGIAEGVLGVLLPSILETYHLTPATVTLLFLSQVAGYIMAAIASSLIVSRMGLARMLLIASVMLTSALCIYAFTTRWFIMVASGTLLGLGIGLIDAGINTFIASDRRNANLMGMLHAFYGIGALLGPALATTLLALGIDWRQVYLVTASVVGLTIVGMFWAVWNRYQPMSRRAIASDTNASASLRLALRSPIVLVASLLLLVNVGIEASLGNWAYTVQNVSRGIPAWIAGYSISGYWLGMTIGRLGMGQAVKHLGAVRTLDISLALLVASLLAWALLPGLWLSLPLIGLALAAIYPATIWLMPQRVPTTIVPAAIGFLSSIGSLGAATIPTASGWIANRLGLEVIPGILVILAGLIVVLHRWLVQHAPARVDSSKI